MNEPTGPSPDLGEALGDAFDEGELAAGLRGVERRLHRRKVIRRTGTGLVVLVGTAALLVAIGMSDEDARPEQVAEQGAPAPTLRPLRLTDGRALDALDAENGAIAFEDGSLIQLGPDSALRSIGASPDEVRLVLDRGRARFDVQPHGPRLWTVQAGAVRVEVLGTAFTVTRSQDRVEVEVHRGLVSVSTTTETRRLHAGERLAVGPSREASPEEPVVEPPERQPVPPRESLTELVERSDQARARGDTDAAIDALRTIVRAHGSSAAAPAAAITWARLEEQRGNTGEAERIYLRCISSSPPPALLSVSYERLIRIRVRRGVLEQAARDLDVYRARFPESDRIGALERLVRP